MKDIYKVVQLLVLGVFFVAFVATGYLVITGNPSPAVTGAFNEMKTLFLGLLAVDALKKRIADDTVKEVKNEVPAVDTASQS